MTKTEALLKMSEDIKLRGLSESTATSYPYHVKRFFAFCDTEDVSTIDELDVREYVLYMIDAGMQNSTINTIISTIRFFFGATMNRTVNYLQLPRMKNRRKFRTILDRDEICDLIRSLSHDLKYQAIVMLGYGSGLRICEVASLKVRNIDRKNNRLIIENGKGGKDRFALLPKETLQVLGDYWRAYKPDPNGYLFPDAKHGHVKTSKIAYDFKKILKWSTIEKHITFHTLRHSFATHMLENGINIIKLKELMGHNTITTTMRYLHLLNNTDDAVSPLTDIFVSGVID